MPTKIPVLSYSREPEFLYSTTNPYPGPTTLEPMSAFLDATWQPWRSGPALGGRRPTKADLAEALDSDDGREDVLPYPSDQQSAGTLRVLITGINPSPWTAAVNAPFARPGNRFWKSLAAANITPHIVDASTGLSPADERMLAEQGVGITNLVSRPTARAAQLDSEELRAGAQRLTYRAAVIRPNVVAILGVTAFRTAFSLPRATLGRQQTAHLAKWPEAVQLWVLPNPSGLNAHENIATLAEKWRTVWSASRCIDTGKSGNTR